MLGASERLTRPFQLGARDNTGMRSRNRLPVTFKLLPTSPLAVPGIPNLEPSAVLSVGHIRRLLVLGDNALQIEFANLLEKRDAFAVNMIHVLDTCVGPTIQQSA